MCLSLIDSLKFTICYICTSNIIITLRCTFRLQEIIHVDILGMLQFIKLTYNNMCTLADMDIVRLHRSHYPSNHATNIPLQTHKSSRLSNSSLLRKDMLHLLWSNKTTLEAGLWAVLLLC